MRPHIPEQTHTLQADYSLEKQGAPEASPAASARGVHKTLSGFWGLRYTTFCRLQAWGQEGTAAPMVYGGSEAVQPGAGRGTDMMVSAGW